MLDFRWFKSVSILVFPHYHLAAVVFLRRACVMLRCFTNLSLEKRAGPVDWLGIACNVNWVSMVADLIWGMKRGSLVLGLHLQLQICPRNF